MSKMIKILNVRKDKKKYIATTIDKEYTFCEDTIIKHYIFKDKEFTLEEFEEIIKSEKENSLFNKTLNFISYQARSTKEIIDYLKEKDSSINETENIMKRLVDLGYINDEIFSKNILDSVILRRKGPNILKQKLKIKGVDEEQIKNTIELYTTEKEEEVLDEVISLQIKKNNHLPLQKQKQSLYEKLLRDGFTQSLVMRKIERVEFHDESDASLEKEINKLLNKYSLKEMKNKIIASLINKGYEYRKIIDKLNEY